MIELTLLARAYGSQRGKILSVLRSELSSLIRELEVHTAIVKTGKNNHILVHLAGSDAEFVASFLARQYGAVPSIDDLEVGSTFQGFLLDVGRVGYGLYVDIGISYYNQMDALLPLHSLRAQLKMHHAPLRLIAHTFVLTDHLPVDVRLIRVDRQHHEIEAELAPSTIARLDKWLEDSYERVIILGAPRSMVHAALRNTDHMQDIIEIEELGGFEFALICKPGTRATGIIASIGPRLRGVPMHPFIPHEVKVQKRATA